MSAVLTSSMYISTHALTEGDFCILILRIRRSNFNSRPHGGRHRPPEGVAGIWHFNSRPHGGRLRPKCAVRVGATFQLTPSRRATTEVQLSLEAEGISTHALTEGDIAVGTEVTQTSIFQLTPSRRATADNPCSKIDTTFQLTPSRRATRFKRHRKTPGGISTHALTEGDGKFRQIFLLNRGYAYSISLYFLPHFISLLPQILSFQQKSFKFQVRIFLLFSVHLAFALQNQCVHHVKYRFCTNMFYFVFVLFTQIVKPQTIGLFIYDFF